MTERIVVSEAALGELEASRTGFRSRARPSPLS